MEKDVSITLDFEIFHDLNKYNIISDNEYQDFLESNQKRYESIYTSFLKVKNYET